MSGSARDARSLFAAARVDAPGAGAQDAMYRQVALATGLVGVGAAAAGAAPAGAAGSTSIAPAAVAAGAPAAGAVAATASALSIKLLAIGALVGAATTVLAVLLVRGDGGARAAEAQGQGSTAPASDGRAAVGGDGHGSARRVAAPDPRGHLLTAGATRRTDDRRVRDPLDTDGLEARTKADADALAAQSGAGLAAAGAVRAGSNSMQDAPSDLAEEARLVTAARSALVAGDAARALSLVNATRKLGARALEPEELGLEARALRALGRADDAAATELVLKRRYPESALAR